MADKQEPAFWVYMAQVEVYDEDVADYERFDYSSYYTTKERAQEALAKLRSSGDPEEIRSVVSQAVWA